MTLFEVLVKKPVSHATYYVICHGYDEAVTMVEEQETKDGGVIDGIAQVRELSVIEDLTDTSVLFGIDARTELAFAWRHLQLAQGTGGTP